ncbi:Na+/H+ antiporter NhaC family protein [Marinomonas sp. S3726]|uniref:Na+/H+ antiporter NhaC family protein n=1 Tax=Marinomonas sp. S3726 TaxID=579484 RepID=UPI00069816CA|nr:Na+/H+ antiporter NhaC family protein [Marinomonas sp. S3726]
MKTAELTPTRSGANLKNILKFSFAIFTMGLALYGNSIIVDQDYGWFVLLPVIAVFVSAIITHRSIESLLFGSLVGFLLLEPANIFQRMIDTNIQVLSDGITAWIITITFLVGGLIALINYSGGTFAFSNWVSKYAKNRSQTLIASWIMGLVIFVDDYLNALAVSSSMKKLSDKYKVSRQMLAYVVDSTAAPMCVLVPISTWAIFLIGLFEANGVFAAGTGFNGYLDLIPYIFYAWIAVLMVPFVSMGWIPNLGAMKQAEASAAKGEIPEEDEIEVRTVSNPKIRNFILPLIAFMVATWYFDYNTLNGIVFALIFTVPLFLSQKLGSLGKLVDQILDGFSTMIQPMIVVLASFVLQRVNDELGLSPYVLDQVVPFMDAVWLPVLTFLVLSVLAFTTGSFWGVYAIALPVIFPLAQALDANIPMTMGALISAGVFGSHACFFGDATVITSKGAGCSPYSHALTQLPYAAIAGAISAALFYLMA